MSALTSDRKTDKIGTEGSAQPLILSYPVAASTKIYGGAIVALDSSGNAVPASAAAAKTVVGRCEKLADNSAGIAGALSVLIRQGAFKFDNSAGADAIAQANVGQLAYVVDDHTVALTDGAGLRIAAGTITNIDGTQIGVQLGSPSLYQVPQSALTSALGSVVHQARGVVTANVASLSAFNVSTNTDGITYVAGDIVVLLAQTTASQNGPYVVGTVGSGTAPLARPDWFATGSSIVDGSLISLSSQGTVYGGAILKSFAGSGGVVDTNDPKFYPNEIHGSTALVAGTFTISCAVLSSSKTTAILNRTTANTASSTIQYNPSTITAGAPGTGSVVVQAQVAAGTINASDVSTLNWTVKNF